MRDQYKNERKKKLEIVQIKEIICLIIEPVKGINKLTPRFKQIY